MMAVTVDQLLPRLLAGIGAQSMVALEQHWDVHGPPADLRRSAPQELIALIESAGLRGHGGASFPMARKMTAVASRRGRSIVVANGSELALVARHGAGWFRELGTELDPGSALVTLSGAVAAPGVYEIEHGMPLSELLEVARLTDRVAGALVGGYFGTWLPAHVAHEVRLSAGHLREYGAALGAGVIVVLGADACPIAETARVAAWFAAESAGQCGPCVNGLDAIAATIHKLATGAASRSAWSDLERWRRDMPRRGACQHPDGALRFITSALRVFEPELRDHARRGPCDRCAGPAVLPAPVRAALRS